MNNTPNSFDIAQKTKVYTLFAQMFAKENLRVIFTNTPTAYFDCKNRILNLPFLDIPEICYDMFVYHECGHALYTDYPTLDKGIKLISGNLDGKKTGMMRKEQLALQYINVIEDIRIDKLVQQRQPSLTYTYEKAYKIFREKGFFVPDKVKDVTDLSWVDAAKTVDKMNMYFKAYPDILDKFDEEEMEYVDRARILVSFDEVIGLAKELYDRDMKNQEKQEQDEDWEFPEFLKKLLDSLDITVEDLAAGFSSKKFETELEDTQEDIIEIDNYTIPEPTANYISTHLNKSNVRMGPYDNFKKKQQSNVNHLARLFEIKKRASIEKRTMVRTTGQLDMKQIHKYKTHDNIFKTHEIHHDGKNHGMVFVCDFSYSMNGRMKQTFERTILLTDFCKSVNIPFEVFVFGASGGNNQVFQHHEMDLQKKGLLKVLSSSMTPDQYKSACNFLLQADYSWDIQMDMGSTPMTEAYLSLCHYIPHYKFINRIDIMNTIILTDGEADKRPKGIFHDRGTAYMVETNEQLLNIMKDRSGSNVIGFFIGDSFSTDAPIVPNSNYNIQQYDIDGYDEFYVIDDRSFFDQQTMNTFLKTFSDKISVQV